MTEKQIGKTKRSSFFAGHRGCRKVLEDVRRCYRARCSVKMTTTKEQCYILYHISSLLELSVGDTEAFESSELSVSSRSSALHVRLLCPAWPQTELLFLGHDSVRFRFNLSWVPGFLSFSHFRCSRAAFSLSNQ